MRTKKRFLGIMMLSLALILGLMPGMSLTAYADDEPPYAQYKNTTTVIKFDEKDWYLINYDTSTVTLLAKECVASSIYDESGSFVEYSRNPTVKTAVDNWYNINITADAKTAVSGGGMFLLTIVQANAITNADVRKCTNAAGGAWWLCTKGSAYDYAAIVNGGSGIVRVYGYGVKSALGVRPALKLDLSKVTFDSESKTFAVAEAVVKYPLWVGGTQVTSTNASDVLGDADEGATVVYTPAVTGDTPTPATLTLTGANITTGYEVSGSTAAIYTTDDLIVTGSGSASNVGFGIHIEGEKTLTLNGDFDLTATKNGIYLFDGCGLVVKDGTVNTTGGNGGAGISGKVTLVGGTLTVTGGAGGSAFGDGASVTIAEDYAYTNGDGTTVYLAGTYTKNTNPSIDDFDGKTLSLCEARIGDTFYPTLQAALNEASNGATVTLLRDVEQKTTLNLSHAASLSLDLNGRKLLFNSEQETDFRYFTYDDTHMYMATITGSGTIEAKGLNVSGNAIIPLWRFCRNGDANTGTLTILDDAAMMNIQNINDCPWAAFKNSITAAVLNEGVTKVDKLVFFYCMNLETVTLPATVTSINEDSSGLLPFNGCPKLEKIMVAAGNTAYSNNNGDGVLYNKDKTELLFCPRGKTGTLTVPATVTTLKKYSFNNDDSGDNSTMSLSHIEFARTEPGKISMDKPFHSYTGDCVLVATDGMLIDNQKQVLVSDYTTGTTISFRAVTAWDDLQDALSKGGTVKLTRSYDYTKDSYKITGWGPTSYYGKLSVPKGTALELNGYTLAAVEFYGDGEFTVKGGTLNCTRLTNNAPTNATYGTLTLDDATVTADQLQWSGGMALTESTLTVGESEEGAGNNGKNINVKWVQPESGAMLTMDTASSVTLPQQQETDGQWRLMDFQTSEDVAAAAGQLGTYLPRGWTFETIKGTRVYGMSELPYYALAVKDTAGAYPTSVTLKLITDSVPATVTANNPTYDGKEKALVNVDKSTLVGGTMYYAVTTGNTAPADDLYTISIPTATEAGTYYVWYMVKGDDDHEDTEPKCIKVVIKDKSDGTASQTEPGLGQDGDQGKVTDDNIQHVKFNVTVKGEDQKPIAVELTTVKRVEYNSKKHVSNYNKVNKSSVADVTIDMDSISENKAVLSYATPRFKLKNNKKATLSGNTVPDKKKSYFIMSFKAKKGATKNQKKQIKLLNKELKKQPVYFKIEPADLSKAKVTAKVNLKKKKVTKVTATINGITMKLLKKDYSVEFVGDKAYIVGQRNFRNRQEVSPK